MEAKDATVAGAVKTILRAIGDALVSFIGFIVRSMLKFDKRVLKRYFNIETALYKYWWKIHSECTQKKLDRLHDTDYASSLKRA